MVNEANAQQPAPLVVTGRVKQCQIDGFTVIGRERGDEPPVGYIANSLEAVDICRQVNQHHALVAALKECITNGEWQHGEWIISEDVYDMAREALAQCEPREP